MAAPTTIPELLDRIRKSGLVAADRLEGFLADLTDSGLMPSDVASFLDQLVNAGLITPFHSDRLKAGKYKGFILGSYRILDMLGSGGMGQVYLAEHLSMKRWVALKVLPVVATDTTEDRVARERFLREARVAATLDHPNIVRVFDLCQEGRLMYLVMEFVDGVSLQTLVAKRGPMPIGHAAHYARQVAFGLQHAHEMGCVHRDIKPANLLVDRTGVVKILDLGLVRSEAEADNGLTRRLDNKGILGTADYVAPEQAVDSSSVDHRADLYSLGATLYFLLSGRPIFPEGRTAQKLVWQQIREPTPIQRLRPEVPDGLAGVVHKLIKKRPEERYSSALEVFDALEEWALETVPPPDEALLPRVAGRVVQSKSGVHSGLRMSSSTSHLVTVAMLSRSGASRSGSGSGPISETARHASHTQSSGQMLSPLPSSGSPLNLPETGAVALDETQRPHRIVEDRSLLDDAAHTEETTPQILSAMTAPDPDASGSGDAKLVLRWPTVLLISSLLMAAGMMVGGLLLLVIRG